ncbi:MAG: cation diffusion facilitator family transporter [Promethearchaeia archaeon]
MRVTVKFGIVSFVIILVQSFLKITAVLLTGSIALLSETIDTIVDIFFAGLTLYSVYISTRPPDFEHMYGHGKIDSIGAVVQGIILSVIYFLLIYNSLQIVLKGSYQVTNPKSGIILIIISFIINMVYSRILIWQGRKQKSLSLKVQGLNLFQDSLRSILVLGSLVFSLYGFAFLDPYFGIGLAVFIIYSSIKLSKEGINELSDANPLNTMIVNELITFMNKIDHVKEVDDIKARTSGRKLFVEVILSVEEHIPMAYADRINKSINSMTKKLFPVYEVELMIQMNPKGGEAAMGERVIKLVQSIKMDYPEILKIKNISLFEYVQKNFISMTMIVNQTLTLDEAHTVCTEFEGELKKHIKEIDRIITHIESEIRSSKEIIKINEKGIPERKKEEVEKNVEKILKTYKNVKGYHGLECWEALNYCIVELHIFFEGRLNINIVHHDIEKIKNEIRHLKIEKLGGIYLHSEPLEGRTDGVIFRAQ